MKTIRSALQSLVLYLLILMAPGPDHCPTSSVLGLAATGVHVGVYFNDVSISPSICATFSVRLPLALILVAATAATACTTSSSICAGDDRWP